MKNRKRIAVMLLTGCLCAGILAISAGAAPAGSVIQAKEQDRTGQTMETHTLTAATMSKKSESKKTDSKKTDQKKSGSKTSKQKKSESEKTSRKQSENQTSSSTKKTTSADQNASARVSSESSGKAASKKPSTALTPKGNMTLVDDVVTTDDSSKEFLTVESRNGTVFYIVIEKDANGGKTVHFLNQVDESDLLQSMDEDAVKAYENKQKKSSDNTGTGRFGLSSGNADSGNSSGNSASNSSDASANAGAKENRTTGNADSDSLAGSDNHSSGTITEKNGADGRKSSKISDSAVKKQTGARSIAAVCGALAVVAVGFVVLFFRKRKGKVALSTVSEDPDTAYSGNGEEWFDEEPEEAGKISSSEAELSAENPEVKNKTNGSGPDASGDDSELW